MNNSPKPQKPVPVWDTQNNLWIGTISDFDITNETKCGVAVAGTLSTIITKIAAMDKKKTFPLGHLKLFNKSQELRDISQQSPDTSQPLDQRRIYVNTKNNLN